MKHWGLTARMSTAIAVVAVAFIASITVLSVAISELRDASDTAQQSERTLRISNRVLAGVVDAETAVRGYAITRREAFLEPLLASRQALPIVTADLTSEPFASDRARDLAQSVSDAANEYLSEYASPLVETLRSDVGQGRVVILAGEGKRRVDGIRAQVAQLATLVQRGADQAAARAADRARTAQRNAIGSGVLAAVLLIGLLLYLSRSIAAPVRRVAAATQRLGQGDLAARVEFERGDEVGQLATSFNAMASSLQANQIELDAQQNELEHQNAELEGQAVELESQTVELEAQAAELEHGQHELTELNESLTAQAAELEAASQALRIAHDRVELFARVADLLGRRSGLEERAQALLESTAELTGSLIGAVYAETADNGYDTQDAVPHLVAARGVATGDLPPTLVAGRGLAGRAMAEGRTVTAPHGEGDLQLQSFGSEVTIRHELHTPLLYGDLNIGVLSLARSGEAPFSAEEISAVEHLAEQAAVAFDNAVVSERRRRLADVNQAVLNATGDAIQMMAPDGALLMSNPPMERFKNEILKYNPDSLDGTEVAEARRRFAQRMADPEAYKAHTERILADEVFEGTDEFEVDGRSIERYTAPVYSEARDFLGRIFVLRDKTDQRELEKAKDELMATVSHELRTPLAAILGFAELLMARDYDREERREHLLTIHQQATRLSELISDFLDMQRLEFSDDGVRRDRVELTAILEQQIALFSAQSGRHKLSLRMKGELSVTGDEDRLRRVMANLISNAIKYSPDGGEVTVEATRSNGNVLIAVEDHGIGIPPEARERVFDRFYRVDSSETRQIGGTGLGLALVREIMKAHGGDVGVDSVEGRGSRFWIKLPAEQPDRLPSVSR